MVGRETPASGREVPVGVAVGFFVGVAETEAVGDRRGVTVGVREPVGVKVKEETGVGVGVGVEVGTCACGCSGAVGVTPCCLS